LVWFGPCIVLDLGCRQDPLLARSVLTSSSALVSFFVGLGRRDFPRWNDSRALSIRNDQVFKTNHPKKSKALKSGAILLRPTIDGETGWRERLIHDVMLSIPCSPSLDRVVNHDNNFLCEVARAALCVPPRGSESLTCPRLILIHQRMRRMKMRIPGRGWNETTCVAIGSAPARFPITVSSRTITNPTSRAATSGSLTR
jgi:hypothetical protein